MAKNISPVALFVYNRPWHTKKTIESLQANTLASEVSLYIFSDAARDITAAAEVEEVRDYIRKINSFKEIIIIEQVVNLGLADSIINGVTMLCNEYGRVIVLEDDLETSPYFLEYMNTALTEYENECSVMQIAGYMYPLNSLVNEDSFFLPFTSSWGWATWSRAWYHFDPSASAFQNLVSDPKLRRAFDLNGHYQYFKMLQSQLSGGTNSWAIRWYLSVFMLNGLVLYPKRSLVKNIGFDGTGVNCVASSITDSPIDKKFRVIYMPNILAVSGLFDVVLDSFPKPKLKIKSVIIRTIKNLKKILHEKYS